MYKLFLNRSLREETYVEYERILAIGDLHGNFDRLLSVFHKIQFREGRDFLIFLGDYVDRGPESMRCLRWAMEMSEKEHVVFLRGNHEQMMLAYYEGHNIYGNSWLPNGGNATKRDLNAWIEKDPMALEKSLEFIRHRPLYHQLLYNDTKYIFCHAGLKPGIPLEDQREEDLLWIRGDFYKYYHGNATVVVGHTPVQYLMPDRVTPIRLKNNIWLVDTGSFLPQGRISCVDVLNGTLWQSDPGR